MTQPIQHPIYPDNFTHAHEIPGEKPCRDLAIAGFWMNRLSTGARLQRVPNWASYSKCSKGHVEALIYRICNPNQSEAHSIDLPCSSQNKDDQSPAVQRLWSGLSDYNLYEDILNLRYILCGGSIGLLKKSASPCSALFYAWKWAHPPVRACLCWTKSLRDSHFDAISGQASVQIQPNILRAISAGLTRFMF